MHLDLLLPCGFLAVANEKASNPPNPSSRPTTRQQVSGGDPDGDGADDIAKSMENEVPEYWIRIPTNEEFHEEALGILTPALGPPV